MPTDLETKHYVLTRWFSPGRWVFFRSSKDAGCHFVPSHRLFFRFVKTQGKVGPATRRTQHSGERVSFITLCVPLPLLSCTPTYKMRPINKDIIVGSCNGTVIQSKFCPNWNYARWLYYTLAFNKWHRPSCLQCIIWTMKVSCLPAFNSGTVSPLLFSLATPTKIKYSCTVLVPLLHLVSTKAGLPVFSLSQLKKKAHVGMSNSSFFKRTWWKLTLIFKLAA